MFISGRLIVLIFSVAGVAGSALAQIGLPNETYIVRNIRSEAESLTSTDASEIAIRNARLIGFRELLSRIVPAEHRPRVRVPSDDQLNLMILSNFDRDTRSGLTTFRIVTDVEFDMETVYNYLETSGIPYVKEDPQELLIVPQQIDPEGVAVVFDNSNMWLSVMGRLVRPNSVSWVLPQENEANALALSPSLIEFRSVENILSEQNLPGGYIARITQQIGETGVIDQVSFQALRIGTARGPARVDGLYALSEMGNDATLSDLYNMALSDLTNAVTDEWLATASVTETRLNEVNVVVLALSTDDWFNLADRLEADPIVNEASFLQTRQGALDVSVKFRGSLEDLQQLFTDLGFMFEAYNLIGQPDVVGFLLQPQRLRLPAGVNILDISLIRLRNDE